jgi:hypothetical protein
LIECIRHSYVFRRAFGNLAYNIIDGRWMIVFGQHKQDLPIGVIDCIQGSMGPSGLKGHSRDMSCDGIPRKYAFYAVYVPGVAI